MARGTPFAKGQSGNPSGRPKGSKNKRTLAAQALHDAAEDVTKAVIESAKGGDMQAARLCLDRIQPPLRPRAETVQFDLDPEAPLHQQGQQVLAAVAAGDLDPETGKLLVECLSAFAGLKQTDELALRIAQLEQAAHESQCGGIAGGVLQQGEAS